jgi:hypothetical protein
MQDQKDLVLKTDEAMITTVSVTIQALKIGKKQMTQSIFRQLPEEPLVDEVEVVLNGSVWGHVCYYWKGTEETEGRHFVFQKGDRLVRCPFLIRRSEAPSVGFRNDEGGRVIPEGVMQIKNREDLFLELWCYLQVLNGEVPDGYYLPEGNSEPKAINMKGFLGGTWVDMPRYFGSLYVNQSDIEYALTNNPSICVPGVGLVWGRDCWEKVVKYQEITRQAITARLKKICVSNPEPKIDWIYEELRKLQDRYNDYCKRWDALMDQLEAVEQLYIAV